MLTDKAKELLEEWLEENHADFFYDRTKEFELWNLIPFSMQWGVHLEFADRDWET